MFGRLHELTDWIRHRAQLRVLPPRMALGRRGEDLAHRFLRRKGMTVIARNWRAPFGGELDIVGWDGATLAIVEVKTRETAEFGTPDRNIGPEKERALIRAARQFIREAGVGWEHVRFDVVSVVMGKPPLIEHHPDVFYPERGTRS